MPLDAIVVVAHGPRRVTADAVERAKALATAAGSDLVVVPATRHAQRPLGSLRSPLVTVVESPGRDGLANALDRADDDVVLLLHDDVLVTHGSLSAMLRVHDETQAITTAWNNDVDQPNSIGMLPVTRRAETAIDRTAAGVRRSVDLPQVRPSCLVATSSQLRRLLPHRLSVSRTLLRAHGIRIVAAAHAVVAHDSTCVQQLAPPASPDGRPLLTAALIVRDEEANLPACLASLQGLVDRIVVCDTGSRDRTIQIARDHGADVMEAPWREDFAWARNQVLDRCRDSWYVLQVDADERVSCDADEVRRVLASDVDDSVGFTVRIDNLGPDDRVQTSHVAVRLFRPDGVQYVGALHEMPMKDGESLTSTRLEGMTLSHTGYRQAALVERDKLERNVGVSRQGYEADPNPLTALHHARSLIAAAQDPDDARRLLLEALEGGLSAAPQALALALVGRLELADGNAEDALAHARRALDLVPADDTAAQLHAEAGLETGRFGDVVAGALDRRRAPSVEPYSSSTVARANEMLAVARAHIALDDLPAAAEAACEALDTGFLHDAEAWVDVVSILVLADQDHALERLADAAARDTTGRCLDAVVRTVGSRAAGPFATGLVAQGHVAAEAVKIGLAWAIVTGDAAALDVLTPHGWLLEPEAADRLMQVAAQRGNTAASARLAQGLLARV